MTFKKGTSGNPAGREKGVTKIEPLRQALMLSVPAIIDSLTAAALAGDIQAAKLLLERVFPALKAVEQPVSIAMPGESLCSKGADIIRAVGQAEIPATTGSVVMSTLLSQAKLLEQNELVTRINDLEIMVGELRGK